MRFFDPTNTYAERNCIQNHKKDLLALGTRAFVITGHSSSKKNGDRKSTRLNSSHVF